MSNFTKFLIKMGVNSASVEMIGGRLVGVLSGLNATNAGGYMNPNVIDGYTFNESDGVWYGYPPSPDTGTFDWFSPASAAKQAELNQQRYWREMNNHIEHASPAQGEAGDLFSPSLFDLLRMMPEIIDRYKEIAPDIWGDLKSYSTLGDLSIYQMLSGEGLKLIPSVNFAQASLELIASLQSKFAQAEATISPLVLDLDGDGVSTLSKTAGVHFDHNGNGFAEQTGWADAADGMLAFDRNGNGTIDSGAELFGNHTRLADGTLAANGFAALADFDSDQDGDVDSADAGFGGLRVWRDLNSNGITENGELLTLQEAGVQSLSVNYTEASGTDGGNSHRRMDRFARSTFCIRFIARRTRGGQDWAISSGHNRVRPTA